MPIERINAVEANLLSLVKIVDDLQKETNALKVIVSQHSVALSETDHVLDNHLDRIEAIEGLVVP